MLSPFDVMMPQCSGALASRHEPHWTHRAQHEPPKARSVNVKGKGREKERGRTFILSREKSLMARPSTIVHFPAAQLTGNE
eukprot:3046505-Rhodomonas_salina.1